MWNDIINYNQLILLGPQGKRELEWVITDFSGKGWENNVQALNGNSKCDRTEPTTIVWYETRDNQSQIVKLDENRWTVDDSFLGNMSHMFIFVSYLFFWDFLRVITVQALPRRFSSMLMHRSVRRHGASLDRSWQCLWNSKRWGRNFAEGAKWDRESRERNR